MLEGLEACAAMVPEEAALRAAITDMHAWEACINTHLDIPAGHPSAAPEQVPPPAPLPVARHVCTCVDLVVWVCASDVAFSSTVATVQSR